MPTDERECVVCDRPIEQPPGGTGYVHLTAHGGLPLFLDHRAQPKLWHAMDDDPFAPFNDEEY